MTVRKRPNERDANNESSEGGRVYGVMPVMEALRAGRRSLEHVAISDSIRHERLHELLELARSKRVPIRRVPRTELDRTAGGATHQGVIARVSAASYDNADDLIEDLARKVGTPDPPLALALDGLEDPRNFGAVLRTAECAGVHGVVTTARRAVGLTETVAKASAGALEYVHVARVTNLSRLIEQLKERYIWVVGAAGDSSRDYTEWDWKLPTTLVLGGEGAGLHRLVRERCDELVRIPLLGHLESLNVSVAGGIILYEAVRQRRQASTGDSDVLSKVRRAKY